MRVMNTPLAMLGLLIVVLAAADVSKTEHPFVLWTKKDLAEMQRKVAVEPWAEKAYEQMTTQRGRCTDAQELFRYAVMGDAEAGAAQKEKLLRVISSPHPLDAAMEFHVLAYDILYDELSDQQRAAVETEFREYIRYAIKPGGTYDTSVYNNERDYARYDGENGRYTRTNWLPNIIFPWKLSANLMAVALRDEELIRKTWATHGSIQWYFDKYLCDLGFYGEEFSKMTSTPGALLMYCTGVRNLGLDELGFAYRGKSGASMRGHIESVLHFTFPGVDTGTNRWRFERVSAGDGHERTDRAGGGGQHAVGRADIASQGHGREALHAPASSMRRQRAPVLADPARLEAASGPGTAARRSADRVPRPRVRRFVHRRGRRFRRQCPGDG